MKKRFINKKTAKGVSIIGGADGPTSIFIAGRTKKPGIRERIKRALYEKKRKQMETIITADPHTLEEVIAYLQRRYDVIELSEESREYEEQKKSLRQSLIIKHKPELLGDLAELKQPEEYNEESLKALWNQIELQSQRANEISEELFPINFHIYRWELPSGGRIEFEIETIWKVFGTSYSGGKKEMKQLERISKEAYLYYGVSQEDIENCTERYSALLTILCR